MKLSQGNLTILDSCPRLFQYTVLEQLAVPQRGEEWEKMQLGSQFHQLMQQRSQHLPIEAIAATDPDLRRWFEAVEAQSADLFPDAGEAWTDSEHVRTMDWMGHTIVGVYDYVVLRSDSAQILDWKTYPKPVDSRRLQQSWQSRLYPLLLARSSNYSPDTIEMRYWFFQGGDQGQPQMLRFESSAASMAETTAALTQRLIGLNVWLTAYELTGESFPQTEIRQTCETCSFAVRCDRVNKPLVESDLMQLETAWDSIEEVELTKFP